MKKDKIKLMVWGKQAGFSQPGFKTDSFSYPCITPASARGIMDNIFRKPEFEWIVTHIHIINPINYLPYSFNGVSKKPKSSGIDTTKHRVRIHRQELFDPRYVIEAKICVYLDKFDASQPNNLNRTKGYVEQFERRVKKGRFFDQPYLGRRNYFAFFQLVDKVPPCHESLKGEHDYGIMENDWVYTLDANGKHLNHHTGQTYTRTCSNFPAISNDGCIAVPSPK